MRVKIDGHEYQVAEAWREALEPLVQRLSALSVDDLYTSAEGCPVLIDSGPRRIAIIKEVRSATGMNLKDAKALSDRVSQGRVHLPLMPIARAQAFVNAVNNQGGRAEMPEPPVIERLAKIAEQVEQETPVAEELFTVFMNAQKNLADLLKAGELNGVFRDKIESYLGA